MSVLNLPAQLQTIEEEAFSGILSQAVIVPEGCTAIGPEAFANCPNLIYILIPQSMTGIDEHAFDGCHDVVVDRKSGD